MVSLIGIILPPFYGLKYNRSTYETILFFNIVKFSHACKQVSTLQAEFSNRLLTCIGVDTSFLLPAEWFPAHLVPVGIYLVAIG